MHRTLLIAGLALLVSAVATPDGAEVEEHIGRLGDERFDIRREATWALVELGDPALPALAEAAEADDPEVRTRARFARRMIQWRFNPELAGRVGDPFANWPAMDWHERERAVMDIGAMGGEHALRTLEQVLKSEQSEAVRRAAAVCLLRAGAEGLLALERSGGDVLELHLDDIGMRIRIGNGLLEAGKYEEALVQYRMALEIDPEDDVAWYNIACAYSLMEDHDEAVAALEKSVEFGYDDLDWMQRDPDLDNIRDHPRYKALVEKLEQRRDGGADDR